MKNTLAKLKTILPQSTDSALIRHMKTRRLIRAGGYTMLAGMALYAICFIFPPVHHDASHAITGTSVASDTTLSISIDNDVLSLDLTPVSTNGTFATTTTPATVYVTTNNITGYTLGIRTSTSSDTATKLINNIDECVDTPSSTKCSLPTLSSPVSSDTYAATTSTDLNNTWGYSPSKYNSEQNEDYLPAPTVGDLDIINITTGPNEVNTNNENSNVKGITDELVPDEYTINLGSRIDYTPYAGQYSGTLVLTAVGNPVPYSVSYDANKPAQAPATANVDNVPTAQTGNVSSGDTIAVLLSNKVPTIGNTNPNTNAYEYAGYVFAGWCDIQPNEDTNTGYQTCPDGATLYQPGDTFGIDQTVDNTEILYAVWGAPATVTFDGNDGLVFNDTALDTTNAMQYIPTYEGGMITGAKTNVTYTGTYAEPAPITTTPPTNYVFKGWSTDATATTPTYATEQDILNNLDLTADSNITLYAVWSYTTIITFDGNGNDADNTPMADITVEAGQTVTLPQNTYTKDGYIFNGWNTIKDPTEQDPGETYADQADFTAGSQSADVTLYAQWKQVFYMQDVATWGSTLQQGDTIEVVDSRDGKSYWVAKLADDNIWMTQNLDHNIVSTPNFYTYENTDIGHGTTPDPTATWTGTATRATSDTAWTGSETAPESYDPGDLYWNGVFWPEDQATCEAYGGEWYEEEEEEGWCESPDLTTTNGDEHYHLGNYYNWTAAVAMSDSSSYTTYRQDADQSICPSGWRLPTYSGDKSYLNLKSAQGLTAGTSGNIQSDPTFFVYGGTWAGYSDLVGFYGYYYSSVVYDSGNSQLLLFDVHGFLDPHGNDDRSFGYSLRCVAR